MTAWNYSTLDRYTTCPRRYWLGSTGDPPPPSNAQPSRGLALGSWVHDAVEAATASGNGVTFSVQSATAFSPIPAVQEWIDHPDTSPKDAARMHADFTAAVVRAKDAWDEVISQIPGAAEIWIERAFYADEDWQPYLRSDDIADYDPRWFGAVHSLMLPRPALCESVPERSIERVGEQLGPV